MADGELSHALARSRHVNWNPTRRGRGAFTSACWRTLKRRGSWGRSRRTWSAGAAWVSVSCQPLVSFSVITLTRDWTQFYLLHLHFMSPRTSQSSKTINRPLIITLTTPLPVLVQSPNNRRVSTAGTHSNVTIESQVTGTLFPLFTRNSQRPMFDQGSPQHVHLLTLLQQS